MDLSHFTACETTAAIAVHLRELAEGEKQNFSGNSGVEKTLCGMQVGWDLKFDLHHATCLECGDLLAKSVGFSLDKKG